MNIPDMPHQDRRCDMVVTLSRQPRLALQGLRHATTSDRQALAALLLEAYRGTVDQEEETPAQALAEIDRLLAGVYGPWLPQFSQVVQREGVLVAATLVTRWGGAPFVAFCMTHPTWKRQGLARAGLHHAMQDLCAAGESTLHLVVTRDNTAAVQLYTSFGFEIRF